MRGHEGILPNGVALTGKPVVGGLARQAAPWSRPLPGRSSFDRCGLLPSGPAGPCNQIDRKVDRLDREEPAAGNATSMVPDGAEDAIGVRLLLAFSSSQPPRLNFRIHRSLSAASFSNARDFSIA
jgi:hypothetical protein